MVQLDNFISIFLIYPEKMSMPTEAGGNTTSVLAETCAAFAQTLWSLTYNFSLHAYFNCPIFSRPRLTAT